MRLISSFFTALVLLASHQAHAQKKLNDQWRSERPFELVHQSNFAEKMGITPSDSTRDKLIAIEITASWCMYCPGVERQMLEAKKQLGNKLTVYQFDYDEGWDGILMNYGGLANGLPGLTLYKNGVPIGQIAGLKKSLDPVAWIHDREAQQDFDQIKALDQGNAKEITKIKDKYVLILMWNGQHMWGEENRAKAHEAKKVFGDRLEIYQYWSHSFTDEAYNIEKAFFKKTGWMENYTPGLGIALIKNGKVLARYQDDEFTGDIVQWIQNEGPSHIPKRD